MATGLRNPAGSPLRLAPLPSLSSPPASFLCVGQVIGCPLRTTRPEQRRLRLRLSGAVKGGGSAAGGRLLVRCGIAAVTEAEFEEVVLKSELPVLVEFVAEWCGPCRLISPVIEWGSQEYKGRLKVVKIDHDANPQLIEQYKVYGLPALILFKDGQEVRESRREGAVTKVKLKEYLDSLLASISVA